MPIRKLILHTCILGLMLPSSAVVRADAALWSGSYAADGACFCAGTGGRNFDSAIVPTPVGGQSVGQVCERLGKGPELQEVNGKFNFTVYEDAQCGNGPFDSASTIEDNLCLGHLGVAGEDCAGAGPKWDLKAAYSKKAQSVSSTQAPLGISDKPSVTGAARYITPPVSQSVATQSESTNSNSSQTRASVQNTPVAEIVETRNNATQIASGTASGTAKPKVALVPETREQIRARQIEQLAAARDRADREEKEQASKIAAAKPVIVDEPSDTLLPEKAAALPETVDSQESVESVAKASSTESSNTNATTTVSALKVPAFAGADSRSFDYVEGAPVSYDFGGAGISVAASKSSHNRMQYLLSAAAAESYQEAAIGVGVFIKPVTAERMTIIANAGLEYGIFNFSRGSIDADVADTGAFLRVSSRFAVTQKFALQAGIGYSSFFEGDAIGFGSAFYNMTPNFDITAKAEAGDNDLLGFGIRFHY